MENQRLKELAGLITEKKWSGEVKTKWKPTEGTFTGKAGSIVKALLDAPGGAKKAMSRLNFYINRAGDKLENREELEKAKAALEKKIAAMKEEVEGVARRAGIILEKKSEPEDMEPDMDMGDGDEAPKAKGDDEEEESLPKIVKKIAKKAVGKDVEELEELIMKVYSAGHKDGEKEASEKKEKSVKESVSLTEKFHVKKGKKVMMSGSKAECEEFADEHGGEVVKGEPMTEQELAERHHVKKKGKVVKSGSKAEMDAMAAGDKEMTVHKGEEMTEEELSEKHHVKKGGKVTFKGSKKGAMDHADEHGGQIVKGDPDEQMDEEIDLESAILEDEAAAKKMLSMLDHHGKTVMTSMGKGVITGIVKQAKTTADGKAGPYVHSVTVRMGDNTVHVMPANQVKLFKGKKPDGKMLPKGVGSLAIASADKGVVANGGKESGTKPSGKSMWKA